MITISFNGCVDKLSFVIEKGNAEKVLNKIRYITNEIPDDDCHLVIKIRNYLFPNNVYEFEQGSVKIPYRVELPARIYIKTKTSTNNTIPYEAATSLECLDVDYGEPVHVYVYSWSVKNYEYGGIVVITKGCLVMITEGC